MDFIYTQANTPVGRDYHNSYFKGSITIDEHRRQKLPQISPFSNASRFKSCAIIGNSGILQNTCCGREIDSYQFVMSYGLLNDSHNVTMFQKAMSEYKGYILWIPNAFSVPTTMAFNVSDVLQNTRLNLLLSDVKYFKVLQSFWNLKKQLSSGLIVFSMGLTLCDELHIYGFWPFPFDWDGNDVPYHYTEDYSWSTYKKTHDFPEEFDLLTKLHSQGVLKLHADKCIM
uniref:CMP-N-acetylneuraminate-poly-alpha-2, 8-sialyltransferase-like n=1 Tax=Saccoglossus kowalevskii TaxID=10224 RepID=A0ABM0MBJ9_SACKO|nr:PREDICTED: CMP-N-acetylneuraminate-poly-alpha-2,8-sialyltransferase-like [Saccoglossus kowalevskii]